MGLLESLVWVSLAEGVGVGRESATRKGLAGALEPACLACSWWLDRRAWDEQGAGALREFISSESPWGGTRTERRPEAL